MVKLLFDVVEVSTFRRRWAKRFRRVRDKSNLLQLHGSRPLVAPLAAVAAEATCCILHLSHETPAAAERKHRLVFFLLRVPPRKEGEWSINNPPRSLRFTPRERHPEPSRLQVNGGPRPQFPPSLPPATDARDERSCGDERVRHALPCTVAKSQETNSWLEFKPQLFSGESFEHVLGEWEKDQF